MRIFAKIVVMTISLVKKTFNSIEKVFEFSTKSLFNVYSTFAINIFIVEYISTLNLQNSSLYSVIVTLILWYPIILLNNFIKLLLLYRKFNFILEFLSTVITTALVILYFVGILGVSPTSLHGDIIFVYLVIINSILFSVTAIILKIKSTITRM